MILRLFICIVIIIVTVIVAVDAVIAIVIVINCCRLTFTLVVCCEVVSRKTIKRAYIGFGAFPVD